MFGLRRLSTRPPLPTVLPKKRTLNRLLFDHDSRLAHRKVVPILQSVYDNLDQPEQIRLPPYTKHQDLMSLREVLRGLRAATSSVNPNLVALENELVEQAAELGNPDAISILAFEVVSQPDHSDYEYATGLIRDLSEQKHPLVFKLAGDLAFSKNHHDQAAQYWQQFLELEDNTVLASHVYANLGIYYFTYHKPRPDLKKAKHPLLKAVKYGNLDTHTVKAHYYLGQLHLITDPVLSRYHLEISASRGLQESFPALGFMELNVFSSIPKALEWFRLGVEANNDLTCMVGQFDAHMKAQDYKSAFSVLTNLEALKAKLQRVLQKGVPDNYKDLASSNSAILATFFETRKEEIKRLPSQLA